MYLKPIFDLGFYYDDWSMLAALGDAPSQSLPGLFDACRTVEPAGRPGTCMYHATVNWILGDGAAGYHILSIVFLSLSAVLLYALLRRFRLGHWAALVVCLFFVVYPGSNSTRLWPTGVGAQYILAVYFGALLLGIEGLRQTGRRSLAFHAASFAMFVLLVFTYEAVIVLIGAAAVLYLFAVPRARKAALWRGGIDLGLAGAFTAYRVLADPVSATSGFTQTRTVGQTLDRVDVVVRGAWASWRPLFLPGTVAKDVVLVAGTIWIIALIEDRGVRKASLRWLIVGAVACAFAVASVLPYVAGNDLYVPQPESLFNRLNFAAAPAYCAAFVALCGLLWTALLHWIPRSAAAVVVGALVLSVAISQVKSGVRIEKSWAVSWSDQQAAIRTLEDGLTEQPDVGASIMSFGHPIWELGFVPVFSASWDLRGAIDLKTRLDPSLAIPFVDAATCGARGVLLGGAPYSAYRGAAPLWFVDLKTGATRRITNSASCNATIAEWGRPPFWGPTVTGTA